VDIVSSISMGVCRPSGEKIGLFCPVLITSFKPFFPCNCAVTFLGGVHKLFLMILKLGFITLLLCCFALFKDALLEVFEKVQKRHKCKNVVF
jgi:hypothetical protein